MATITHHTQHKIDDFPVDYAPCEWIDPHVVIEGDEATITYAVNDDDPSEYEWGEVKFWQASHRYVSPHERDDVEAMPHVYLVERYEHGNVIYALNQESSQVDRQWDVSVCGLIGIPEDYPEPEDAARAVLAEYSDWCNGSVYGIVTEKFARGKGTGWAQVEADACWGFIGTSHAQTSVNEGGF